MSATLAYSAPEVITGAELDGRADVYALACTLFRLLTGEHPYPTDAGVGAPVKAHLDTTPPRVSDRLTWASPQLDSVIAKALAKTPADRYPTAGDFAAAAAAALTLPAPRRQHRLPPIGTHRHPTLSSAGPSPTAPQLISSACSRTPVPSRNGAGCSRRSQSPPCSSSPCRCGLSAAAPTRPKPHPRRRHRRPPRPRRQRWKISGCSRPATPPEHAPQHPPPTGRDRGR
ncbi:protein kinase domain-containing protein [Mycolicibacterium doricum]|uniref:protein kinase domain-containing protein n=1 Tax=Mycolicibacterium doricum TaxID=126673 RepID=UPI0021F06012|nr:hypothetical protein [Mycolicibacterium doricum]